MITFIYYLLKVSVSLIVFYLLYILLFKHFTFFLLNRLYLISCLLIAFILPLLHFSIFKEQSENGFITILNKVLVASEADFYQPNNYTYEITTFNYQKIFSAIYIVGVSFLFSRLLYSIIKILHIKNHAEIEWQDRIKIIKTNALNPFSFFNLIFIPKENATSLIIEHEKAHIKQFHWFDLLLVEAISIMLWFNPFILLYKRSLTLQHEYLADNYVVRQKSSVENYLDCILQQVKFVSLPGPVNYFHYKKIKKRIIMITKNNTPDRYKTAYLLLLPVLALLLFSFTYYSNGSVQMTENVISDTVKNKPSISPVNKKDITSTSGYGERKDPFTGKKIFHYAIDFAVPDGEPIMSTANGKVSESKTDSLKGNYVLIIHDNIYATLYSHLKKATVKPGENVKKGQVIGYAGNTGLSTGPHLHYEIYENGKRVNPSDFIPSE